MNSKQLRTVLAMANLSQNIALMIHMRDLITIIDIMMSEPKRVLTVEILGTTGVQAVLKVAENKQAMKLKPPELNYILVLL